MTEAERKRSVELVARVEELRREAGVSKQVMYDATGTSASAISQWKSGHTKPSMRSVEALAAFFSTSPQFLLFGETGKPAPQGELSSKQRELIDLIRQLQPSDVAALLAAARELAAAQQYPGIDE